MITTLEWFLEFLFLLLMLSCSNGKLTFKMKNVTTHIANNPSSAWAWIFSWTIFFVLADQTVLLLIGFFPSGLFEGMHFTIGVYFRVLVRVKIVNDKLVLLLESTGKMIHSLAVLRFTSNFGP